MQAFLAENPAYEQEYARERRTALEEAASRKAAVVIGDASPHSDPTAAKPPVDKFQIKFMTGPRKPAGGRLVAGLQALSTYNDDDDDVTIVEPPPAKTTKAANASKAPLYKPPVPLQMTLGAELKAAAAAAAMKAEAVNAASAAMGLTHKVPVAGWQIAAVAAQNKAIAEHTAAAAQKSAASTLAASVRTSNYASAAKVSYVIATKHTPPAAAAAAPTVRPVIDMFTSTQPSVGGGRGATQPGVGGVRGVDPGRNTGGESCVGSGLLLF